MKLIIGVLIWATVSMAQPHSATLTWVASATDATHDAPSSYNVKRAAVSGGPYATVGSATATTYVDSTVLAGTTYFYVVTAVNSGGESVPSSQVTCTVPKSAPNPPTGLSAVTQ